MMTQKQQAAEVVKAYNRILKRKMNAEDLMAKAIDDAELHRADREHSFLSGMLHGICDAVNAMGYVLEVDEDNFAVDII